MYLSICVHTYIYIDRNMFQGCSPLSKAYSYRPTFACWEGSLLGVGGGRVGSMLTYIDIIASPIGASDDKKMPCLMGSVLETCSCI